MSCSCRDSTDPCPTCQQRIDGCNHCGVDLVRRHDESLARFAGRRYCSNTCSRRDRPRTAEAHQARSAAQFFHRDDFLHEVWFGRTWLRLSDERIAAWLGMTWEAFRGRLARAEGIGCVVDEDVDRWVA